MPQKLTVAQQRALYRALPASRKLAVKKKCLECQMKGDGLFDIIKKIGKTLGHIGKEIGPTVLKEIVAPLVLKKYGGKGLTLPGGAKKRPRKRKTMPKSYLM
jgi:hypothetical protein